MSPRVFFLVIFALPCVAIADVYGDHYGYLFEVKEERNKRDLEMVMLPQPKRPPKPLQEVIFNEKLSKEFQQQYEYRFGQSQAEQVLNTVARSDDYNYYTGRNVTVQEYQKYQRQFAEYMGRRLVEYHVDNWAKNDPDFRPVYEFKDKVSNLNVTVKKGYKVRWKYNFAGPNMEVKVENPYDVDVKVRMEMSGIISSATEMIYTLGYNLTQKVRATALHKQNDGLSQLVLSRPINKKLSTSLTASTDQSDSGDSVKQDLILIGFAWSE
jgi:hypothetical protein